MSKFEEICESFGVIKRTTQIRYPRQIKMSEGFLQSLKDEYYRLKLEEDVEQPIKNRPEKFLKALKFHISELEENVEAELEAMRAKFEEANDERVPEVTIDGEKEELVQNDAPKNTEPKKEELCKGKRIVLKRNMGEEDKKDCKCSKK